MRKFVMSASAVRRSAVVIGAALAVLLSPGHPGDAATHAARAASAETAVASATEIVVLEAPGCIYCPIFRRDVLPAYQASARARTAPLRFLDLNDEAADKLPLVGPVTVVPTVVILREHREVARIPGYIGPDNFFHTVDSVLGVP